MNCNGGAAQTHGTCWFYSIINGFLLSDDGKKILYAKMLDFYKGLTPSEKLYFMDKIDAPCPLSNVSKTKPIYFYKFLDQHLCYISGPRGIPKKAELSPTLLKNIQFVNKNINKNTGGTSEVEIFPILDHLGFKDEYEIRTIRLKNRRIQQWINRVPPPKPKFIVSLDNVRPDTIRSYNLACASIACTTATFKEGHAICGYICNNKPYIIDPNFLIPYSCKWWNYKELVHVLKTYISKPYNYIYEIPSILYSVYARKNYVSRIHPACLRRYKKTPLFNTPANVSSKKRLLKTSILNFFKTKVKPPSPTKNLPNINTVSPSPKSRARGLKRKTRINKK